jgi:hypothetical protein
MTEACVVAAAAAGSRNPNVLEAGILVEEAKGGSTGLCRRLPFRTPFRIL